MIAQCRVTNHSKEMEGGGRDDSDVPKKISNRQKHVRDRLR